MIVAVELFIKVLWFVEQAESLMQHSLFKLLIVDTMVAGGR